MEADKQIKTEELKETLDNSNTGKTTGPDGAPKEFLTRFWPMIGKTILLQSILFQRVTKQTSDKTIQRIFNHISCFP